MGQVVGPEDRRVHGEGLVEPVRRQYRVRGPVRMLIQPCSKTTRSAYWAARLMSWRTLRWPSVDSLEGRSALSDPADSRRPLGRNRHHHPGLRARRLHRGSGGMPRGSVRRGPGYSVRRGPGDSTEPFREGGDLQEPYRVPETRAGSTTEILAGKAIFNAIGCVHEHVSRHETGAEHALVGVRGRSFGRVRIYCSTIWGPIWPISGPASGRAA